MVVKKYVTDILNKVYFEEYELESTEYRNEENNIINIHQEIDSQEWLGLGGALTEATLVNFEKLNSDKQNDLLDDYYNGLNYNFLRLPIGSTDFSTKSVDDYTTTFDENVKVIRRIKEKKDVKILATPWSPPKKFKSNSSLFGGELLKQNYDNYAKYLADFIKDYDFANIKIDYLSMQNEPFASQRWESCTYTTEEMKDFLYNYLIPKIKETKIILWDHNKDNLFNVFKELYENNSNVKGLGFHWYTGGFYEELELMRRKYPNILLFETEMCCGFSKYNPKRWITDSEYYLNEIINGINNGLNVFLDWNMLLNYKGGPNHKYNNCKSPIILNKRENDYIKTPIYYYLKHIGMVGKGKAITTSNYSRNNELLTVGIKNEKTYLTILNKSDSKKKINVHYKEQLLKDTINKHSIITFVIEE